jgi:hypothetical protein
MMRTGIGVVLLLSMGCRPVRSGTEVIMETTEGHVFHSLRSPGEFSEGKHSLAVLPFDEPGRYWLHVEYVVREKPGYGETFGIELEGFPDLSRHGPRIMDAPGDVHSIDWSVDLEETGQVPLILVVPSGLIEVRSVRWSRPGGVPAAPGFRVPNCGTFPREIRDEFQRIAREQRLDRIRDDLLVIVCAEGGLEKVPPRMDEIMARLQPDFIDWIPVVPLGKRYGIRTSSGAMEYQEYYKREGEKYWEDRWEIFGRNGMVRLVNGGISGRDIWGTGGYQMCHSGPAWHEAWLESVYEHVLPQWEAVCQDNAMGGIPRSPGCFCDWCERGFRDFLRDHFSGKELRDLGIEEAGLEEFSVRKRIHATGAAGEEAWRDPVLRLYQLYRYQSQVERWADLMIRIRRREAAAGRKTFLYGNQGGVGYRPFGLSLAPFTDIIEQEEIAGVWENHIPQMKMQTKLPMAAGMQRMPVWVRGPVTDMTQEPPWAEMSPAYWRLHLGEALSNGGIRVFSLGMNNPQTGDPSLPDFMDSEDVMGVYEDFARMLRENRAVFSHTESAAEAAVVYSFPSQMWREAPWLGFINIDGFHEFKNRSHELDDAHVPNDVILFGHPMIVDDSEALANLDRYKAIVLHVAECVSDRQIEALSRYAEKGGMVFAASGAFRFDENRNPREDTDPVWDFARPYKDFAKESLEICAETAGLETDAPAAVTINPRWICGGKGLAFHLMNYDLDVHARTVVEPGEFQVSMKVQESFGAEEGFFLVPGEEPRKIDIHLEESTLTVDVPGLHIYGVAVVCGRDVLDAANREIETRRAVDVEYVKKTARR